MYSQSSKRNSIMLAKERLSPKKMKNILVWVWGIPVKHYVCSDNVNNLFYYMTIKINKLSLSAM